MHGFKYSEKPCLGKRLLDFAGHAIFKYSNNFRLASQLPSPSHLSGGKSIHRCVRGGHRKGHGCPPLGSPGDNHVACAVRGPRGLQLACVHTHGGLFLFSFSSERRTF